MLRLAWTVLLSCIVAGCAAGDACPDDPQKTQPGACGCGTSDADGNGNGVPDCLDSKVDLCPDDAQKTQAGTCGCGTSDADGNGNGVPDCLDAQVDLCPNDPLKVLPGPCGCGVAEEDPNQNGIPNCFEDFRFHFTARVTAMTAPGAAVSSVVQVGDLASGWYSYAKHAVAGPGSSLSVALFGSVDPSHTLHVDMKGSVYETDPASPLTQLELYDNTWNGSNDAYSFNSQYNRSDSGLGIARMSMLLEDGTGQALQSVDLPSTAPDLSRFQVKRLLQMELCNQLPQAAPDACGIGNTTYVQLELLAIQ